MWHYLLIKPHLIRSSIELDKQFEQQPGSDNEVEGSACSSSSHTPKLVSKFPAWQ
jgi:hypothetical protein